MLTFPRILRARGARPAPAEPEVIVGDVDVEFPSVPCNGLRAQWRVGASGRPELSWAVAGPDDAPGVTHLLPRLGVPFPDQIARRSA